MNQRQDRYVKTEKGKAAQKKSAKKIRREQSRKTKTAKKGVHET